MSMTISSPNSTPRSYPINTTTMTGPNVSIELVNAPPVNNPNNEHVNIACEYGDNLKYSLNAEASDQRQIDVDNAYSSLKRSVMTKLRILEGATVVFDLTFGGVEYNYANGAQGSADLLKLVKEDVNIRNSYNALEKAIGSIIGGPLRKVSFEAGKKTDSKNNEPPMQRTSDVLTSLPTNYQQCAKLVLDLYSGRQQTPTEGEQVAALKRIVAMEYIINPQIKIFDATVTNALCNLQANIEILEGELRKLRNTGIAANKRTIEIRIQECKANIKKLLALKKELDSIDRFGLYFAAAFIPHPLNPDPVQHLANVKAAAAEARDILQTHVNNEINERIRQGISTKWPSRIREMIFNKRKKSTPVNTEYPTDVAALIYSSLPIAITRKEVSHFYKSCNSTSKQDCLADELIHYAFAIEMGSDDIPTFEKRISELPDDIHRSLSLNEESRGMQPENVPLLKVELKEKLDLSKREAERLLAVAPPATGGVPVPTAANREHWINNYDNLL